MMPCNVLCIDAGGTFFKYAVYNEKGEQISELMQTPSRSDEDAEAVINVYGEIIKSIGVKISKIGISTPGPFDYVKGMSLMQHKFKALYGVPLKEKIAEFTDAEVTFMSDTNAFASGEYDTDLQNQHKNVLAVTIGTGLGMSVISDGKLLKSETGGVKEVVFSVPYEDGIIEDIVSGRGVAALYGDGYTAKKVSELARKGDKKAQQAFYIMGTALGKVMLSYVKKYNATAIIVGGQVAKSLDLFADCVKAEAGVEILSSKYSDAALRGIFNECINNNR